MSVYGSDFSGVYSPELKADYESLYRYLEIREEWSSRIAARVVEIERQKERYLRVADGLTDHGAIGGDVWAFVAIVHSLEGDLDFSTHLHNGDPLSARTVNVPAGRPRTGDAPFTWEHSASDALLMKGLQREADWSVAKMLFNFERYNGWGYRRNHPLVLSPYLWSGSTQYRVGKYVSDGTYSRDAVSKQIGGAVLLHALGFKLPRAEFAEGAEGRL